MLREKIKKDILKKVQELSAKPGEIFTPEQLDKYYSTFSKKFNPDIISSWEGEELLRNLFLFGNKDSLAYWLEFKNDEEMSLQFGSIAGGSALKYGIYFNKDRQSWTIGSPQKQKAITVSEAIEFVTKQKVQLLKGVEVIKQMPESANIDDYRNIQKRLREIMPDIVEYGWVHKYMCMIFPKRFDDFHNPKYQKYYLIKMLILPDDLEGHYVNAFHYINEAKELNIPVNTLTTTLWHLYGLPTTYWRIGTTAEENDRWEIMKNNNCIAVGWDKLNRDLSFLSPNQESKIELKKILIQYYPNWNPQTLGNKTKQLFSFVTNIGVEDTIIAMNGSKIRGIGRVAGKYYYEKDAEYFRHRIPVKWLSLKEWKLDDPEGLQTTVFKIKKKLSNLIKIEEAIISNDIVSIPKQDEIQLSFYTSKILSVLERKGQVILYGPPGTGKTYHAMKAALELCSKFNDNSDIIVLSEDRKKSLREQYIFSCSFHPGYGYEDFLESYRPVKVENAVSFELKPGIFKKLCDDARVNPSKKYFIIIDEINRGDIPRIFGELISMIEMDKRETSFLLPLSGTKFSVPSNLYIMATMNTADRSIALLDSALRRRFGFIEMMPDYSVLKGKIDEVPLATWLKLINRRIKDNLGQNGRNYQIGHSYLLEKSKPINDIKTFIKVIKEDIIPLIEEYCYDDYTVLEKILGKELFDKESLSINRQLFEDEDWPRIKLAISFNDPELLEQVTSEAVGNEYAEGDTGDDEIVDQEDENRDN